MARGFIRLNDSEMATVGKKMWTDRRDVGSADVRTNVRQNGGNEAQRAMESGSQDLEVKEKWI